MAQVRPYFTRPSCKTHSSDSSHLRHSRRRFEDKVEMKTVMRI
jgi:hypothetical protein